MPDPVYLKAAGYVQLLLLLLIPLEVLLASASRDPGRVRHARHARQRGGQRRQHLFLGHAQLGVLWCGHLRLRPPPDRLPFTWWSFLLVFVLEDCRYYWWHRISHRSRWFWASHVVHHSSQHFNLSINLRQSWTSQFSGLILLNVPLAWIGFHPATIAPRVLAESALSVLDSHRGHRPHAALVRVAAEHALAPSRAPREQSALPGRQLRGRIHDLGSAVRYLRAGAGRGARPLRAGQEPRPPSIPSASRCTNMWASRRICVRPGPHIAAAAGYFFGPPGWSHDGSRGTTQQLRAAELERRARSARSMSFLDEPKAGLTPLIEA